MQNGLMAPSVFQASRLLLVIPEKLLGVSLESSDQVSVITVVYRDPYFCKNSFL